MITPSGNNTLYNPFESLTIDQWNTTTGSSQNAFLRGIWNSASLPTNAQIWMETQSLGSSATPVATFTNNSIANASASPANLTADTSAWDSQVPAWIQSHSYSIGNLMTLGNGQVYICTTGGTSSALFNKPSPVADGATINEVSGIAWRAYVRFQMSVSITPELVGSVFASVKAATATAFWVDPLITSV